MTSTVSPQKIIRLPELSSRIGLTRTSIYRLISQGKFPRQIKLSGSRAMDRVSRQ